MVELTRSSCLLTLVGDLMMERLDGKGDPLETGEVEVLRGMIQVAMPHLRELGAERCWQAAELIEKVRSEIVLDFQLTAEGDERRN
jgi:hypothetical protein